MPEPVCGAVVGQFLLELDFLQWVGLWLCFFMAASTHRIGGRDDPVLLENRQHCGTFANTLYSVAIVCGIPEFWHLAIELK